MSTTKSLARAFTTRRKDESAQNTNDAFVGRAASQRVSNAKPIKRSQISLPVALISTTNMLSYEAPDIKDAPHVSRMSSTATRGMRSFSNASTSSSSSPASDRGHSSDESSQQAGYETDATSVTTSPVITKNDSYLDQFFKSPSSTRSTRSTMSSQVSDSMISSAGNSPVVSSRAASRSTKGSFTATNSQQHRSVQRLATISSHPSEAGASARDSAAMFCPATYDKPELNPQAQLEMDKTTSKDHPFGEELEQLKQVAKEFSFSSADDLADINVIQTKNLARHCVAEYLEEISLISLDFTLSRPTVWI